MMEEDVIPALKSTLEAQDDITDLELVFNDNKVSRLTSKSYTRLQNSGFKKLNVKLLSNFRVFDGQLEGSFMQKDKPYFFWAFFPDGVLTGSVVFSFFMSSSLYVVLG